MKFEDRFPSLRGMTISFMCQDYNDYFDAKKYEHAIRFVGGMYGELIGEHIPVIDVKDHCLDKSKVREAIGQITFARGIDEPCNIHNAVNRERERIKKTLGL